MWDRDIDELNQGGGARGKEERMTLKGDGVKDREWPKKYEMEGDNI